MTLLEIWKKEKYFKYIILFVLIVVVTVIARETGWDKEDNIKYTATIALLVLAVYWCINRNHIDTVKILLLCGFILRVGYMLYTPMTVRSHDLGAIDAGGTGHYGYIYRILTTGRLVDSGDGQFYHPPLFYILSALLVKFLGLFIKADFPHMIEYAKIVSCFFGCMTAVIVSEFVCETQIKAKEIVVAIVSFFPNLILMSGRVNNDALSVFFIVMCIYYTYRWYNEKTIKNIIMLALSFGFGMMSKISCGTIAFFTGTVMVIELCKSIKNKTVNELIKQYIIFAVICIPLSLWYPIRNYILFNQACTYTPAAVWVTGEERSAAALFEKFFSFKFWEVITVPYADVLGTDISIIKAILRTSMFGEFTYQGKETVARVLATVNIVVVITSILSFVYVMKKGKKIKQIVKYGFVGIWACTFIPYLWLNYQIPKNFTMDFRYITMTVITGAAYMALMSEICPRSSRWIKVVTGLFCIMSAIMYIL